MQNTKYILKIQEIYLEWSILNMKNIWKWNILKIAPCVPSKSTSEDTIVLF